MASNLRSRLARIKSLDLNRGGAGLARASELAPPSGTPKVAVSSAHNAKPAFLKAFSQTGEWLWRRELSYSLALPSGLDPSPYLPLSRRPACQPGFSSERVAAERLRVFDLETTGLSGGAGTLAFLASIGRFEGSNLVVRQLFLADYPGEREFVEALLAEFDEGSVALTYNGRSFDMPLLRVRAVMNGLAPPAPAHLDALYPARRLWKRIYGGASLGLLEKAVLGRERANDVPGSMIPEIFFEFLRRGDHPVMEIVMSHNAEDVVGLAKLASRIESVYAKPEAFANPLNLDLRGLGRSLLALGRAREGESMLEASFAEGDAASGYLLCRRYAREGRMLERSAVVERLPGDRRGFLERAKSAEHGLRRPAEALAWVVKASSLARSADETEVDERRITRLERKIKRATENESREEKLG